MNKKGVTHQLTIKHSTKGIQTSSKGLYKTILLLYKALISDTHPSGCLTQMVMSLFYISIFSMCMVSTTILFFPKHFDSFPKTKQVFLGVTCMHISHWNRSWRHFNIINKEKLCLISLWSALTSIWTNDTFDTKWKDFDC